MMTTISEPTNAETRPDRSYVPWYRRMIPRWRTVVVGVLILLALPFAIRWYRLSRLPDVPVPFDVAEFAAIDFSPEENAFTYFNQIPPNIGPNHPWYSNFVNAGDVPFRQGKLTAWNDVPAEVQAVVLQQQAAIRLLQDGGRCAESNYIPAQTLSMTTLIPTVQNLRDAQRLVALDTIRRLDAGDAAGAREVLHDAFRATRHLGRRGCQIERLVGMATHAQIVLGWHQWSRQPQVTAAELESALHHLQADWRLTPPVSDQLKIDAIMALNEVPPPMSGFCEHVSSQVTETLIRATGDKNRAAQSVSFLSQHVPGWERPVLWLLAEPELSARAVKLWVTHELRYCDLPWSEQPPRLPGRLAIYDAPEKTAGLTPSTLNARLGSTLLFESAYYDSWRELDQRRQMEAARQTLLETELRLQIRFRQTDPSQRTQVLTGLDWPVDPCDPQQREILHRADESALVIWSRGPNGIDNGGNSELPYLEGDLIVTIPWPAEADGSRGGE